MDKDIDEINETFTNGEAMRMKHKLRIATDLIEQLRGRDKIMREALEKYANEENYCMRADSNKEFDGLCDEGELARKTLKEINSI
jgi:hypothetical protein